MHFFGGAVMSSSGSSVDVAAALAAASACAASGAGFRFGEGSRGHLAVSPARACLAVAAGRTHGAR